MTFDRPVKRIIQLYSFLVIALKSLTVSGAQDASGANPLLTDWQTPFQVPPFSDVREEHFLPATQVAMTSQLAEIDAIAGSTRAPAFANTIEALENTGESLDRVNSVFSNLGSADTNEKLQAIARELAPLQSAHRDAILMNDALFRRIRVVWDGRAGLALNPEQQMLLEKTYKRFVRGGALLDGTQKARLKEINSQLASLSVKFGDNLLKEMNDYRLVIERKEDLAGLPEPVVLGAAEAARRAGLEGKWVFTLHSPSIWPFMKSAQNRELRRQLFVAYTTRGDYSNATDNKATIARITALRVERARLLGYPTWADYVLEETMAGNPGRVYGLLNRLWPAAKDSAAREVQELQKAIQVDGQNFELQPWDWFYYAEKVCKARYDLDENSLRPYFKLENVRNGAFQVAQRLYGITFTEIKNLPAYNSEVTAFEVKDRDGSHLAVFYVDYHPRPGKRVGAWASRYRPAWVKNGTSVRPIVVNVCNFSRPAGDEPALLTMEEVRTLFHELGHAIHSIVSRVHYRSLGSTPPDFVELPSQIMENWATEPEVLREYARHWKTGEVIPMTLVERIQKAAQFDQGFKTVEYLAASLLDMEWHTLSAGAESDPAALERVALARMGIPAQIVPRYRSTYFQHIFAGGYSAGYYSYIWAEVLDADAFQAFKEKGIFDPETARSFRVNILEKGNTEDPMTLYKNFRGREPEVGPLLKKRGLVAQ